jgi:hypothetical protein
MIRRLKKTLTVIPTIIKLIRGRTPEEGKDIAKSGVTSLAIAGSISAGKLQLGEMDTTLLLLLGILEAAGYLYGCMALSIGASQSETQSS